MKKIVLFGCGGHALSVLDALKKEKEYELIGIVDKEDSESINVDLPVIATDETLECLKEQGIEYGAMGIGSIYGGKNVREKVYLNAKDHAVKFPVIKDDTAIVSASAIIEEGTFVGKGAIINSGAHIGSLCIINTGAILEHCVQIGKFTHVSVGTVICGDVTIGDNCMIGANATVMQGVRIGNNVTVGAGSVVISDVADGQTVVGNPARITGKRNG